MLASYWQEGKNLDYTNSTSAKIPANTVIDLKAMVGVAGTDIEKSETGTVVVHGVFEMTKSGTAAIVQGQKVYFDGTGITDAADNGQTSASKVEYTPAGYAAKAAVDSDTKILVKLLG